MITFPNTKWVWPLSKPTATSRLGGPLSCLKALDKWVTRKDVVSRAAIFDGVLVVAHGGGGHVTMIDGFWTGAGYH